MTTEEKLIGKNIHSVYTLCFECHTWGVNGPKNYQCGSCNSLDTLKYYDIVTVSQVIEETRRQTLFELGRWVRGVNFQGGDINRDMFTAELDRLQTLIDEK